VRSRYEEDRLRLREALVRPLAEPLREDPERDEEPLLRELPLRDEDEAPLREDDARDEPLRDDDDVLRARDDVLRRRVERLPAGLRSLAGTSSRTTAPASVLSWRSRNFCMRSSSRRIARASFAVSPSPSFSAIDSMIV
jgi:hypothetical protein